MARMRITPEINSQILEMRRDGKDAQTIADHFHIGKSTVQRVFTLARKAGQALPAVPGKPGSKGPRIDNAAKSQMRERIMQLRSQGYSYTEIGDILHMTKQKAAYHGMRAQQIASGAIKLRASKGAVNGTEHHESSSERIIDTHVSYVFGRTEAFIEHYADSSGVSRQALTNGVVQLLRSKARW